MGKPKKESAIGLGIGGLGAASFVKGGKAAKVAERMYDLSVEHQFDAMDLQDMSKQYTQSANKMYGRGFSAHGDQYVKEAINLQKNANERLGYADAAAKAGMRAERVGKALKGLGIAGMVAGGVVAGTGMYKETKESYEKANARKAALRAARKK